MEESYFKLNLFLLAFIILILMHFIYIRPPFPVPFLYLSPTPLSVALLSTLIFSQTFFPFYSKIYSAQYFKHFLLYSFVLPRLCTSFRIFRTEKKGTGTIGMFFLSVVHLCSFFLFAVVYMNLVLFICCMSQLVYIGTGLVWVCVCMCTFVSWSLK